MKALVLIPTLAIFGLALAATMNFRPRGTQATEPGARLKSLEEILIHPTGYDGPDVERVEISGTRIAREGEFVGRNQQWILRPGTRLLLRANETFEVLGSLITSGSSENPVVIEGHGSALAIKGIGPAGSHFVLPSSDPHELLQTAERWAPGESGAGIRTIRLHHVRLTGVSVQIEGRDFEIIDSELSAPLGKPALRANLSFGRLLSSRVECRKSASAIELALGTFFVGKTRLRATGSGCKTAISTEQAFLLAHGNQLEGFVENALLSQISSAVLLRNEVSGHPQNGIASAKGGAILALENSLNGRNEDQFVGLAEGPDHFMEARKTASLLEERLWR